jgi:protein SCO1/2
MTRPIAATVSAPVALAAAAVVAVAIAVAVIVATPTLASSSRGGAPAAAAVSRLPPVAESVGLLDRSGNRVPLELPFTDIADDRAPLSARLLPGRPTLLVLAYVRCPMLCSVVLQAVAETVAAMPLSPGTDYNLVTVSIDPRETAVDAAGKQRALLHRIGHDGELARWRLLRGDEAAIRALADALGFRYARDARTGQYAHPAVLFVVTPDGRLSRALPGVEFPPRDVEAALESAARRETTPTIAGAVLRCFRFDPAHRRFRDRIQRTFRIGAVIVFAALLGLIGGLVAWERRRPR